MLSGMTRINLYPRTAATNASPMPVLPLVGSTIVPPRLELALPLGLVDHVQADPILDASAGIEGLHLGVNGCGAGFGQAIETDQRRAADQLRDVGMGREGHRPPPM